MAHFLGAKGGESEGFGPVLSWTLSPHECLHHKLLHSSGLRYPPTKDLCTGLLHPQPPGTARHHGHPPAATSRAVPMASPLLITDPHLPWGKVENSRKKAEAATSCKTRSQSSGLPRCVCHSESHGGPGPHGRGVSFPHSSVEPQKLDDFWWFCFVSCKCTESSVG